MIMKYPKYTYQCTIVSDSERRVTFRYFITNKSARSAAGLEMAWCKVNLHALQFWTKATGVKVQHTFLDELTEGKIITRFVQKDKE
jgi:hypothetical protein